MPTINLHPKRSRMKIGKLVYNNSNNKYYSRFRQHRDNYIQEHPLDELMLLEGKVVPAEHVHHIVPFLNGISEDERFFLLLNPNNFMSLSEDTHHTIHKHYRKLTPKQIDYLHDKYDQVMKQYRVFQSRLP